VASRRAPGLEALDIVCGTLQVKLQSSDLSCGSSPCILLGSRKISPCQFQCEVGKAVLREIGRPLFYTKTNCKSFPGIIC